MDAAAGRVFVALYTVAVGVESSFIYNAFFCVWMLNDGTVSKMMFLFYFEGCLELQLNVELNCSRRRYLNVT